MMTEENPKRVHFQSEKVEVDQEEGGVFVHENPAIVAQALPVQRQRGLLPSIFHMPHSEYAAEGNILEVEGEAGEAVEEAEERRHFAELWLHRLMLCTFCICFLWMTSLQISALIVGTVVETPTSASVIETCQHTYFSVNGMRRDYEKCVDYQSAIAFADLETANTNEKARVEQVVGNNSRFSQAYKSLAKNASTTIEDQRTVLELWMSGGSPYQVRYQPSCVGSTREQVEAYIGDSSDNNQAVLSQSSDYATSSQNRVVRLGTYAEDLNSYNYQYVVNKTGSIELDVLHIAADLEALPSLNASLNRLLADMELINACLTLDVNSSMSTCPYGMSLKMRYDEMQAFITSELIVAQNNIEFLQWMFDRYVDRVHLALSNVNSFYESINGAKGLINWLVNVARLFGGASQLCGKSTPDWCSFSKLDWSVPDPIPGDVINLPAVPSAADLWKTVQQFQQNIQAELSVDALRVSAELEAWASNISLRMQSIDITPHDYNPPAYPGNLSAESQKQNEESEAFLDSIHGQLYNQNSSLTETATDTATATVNSTAAGAQSSLLSLFSSSWASFRYATVDTEWLLASFFSAQGVLYIFDYIYRVVQTMQLIARFWGRGVVKLPTIDLREGRFTRTDVQSPFFRYVQWFLRLIPFIWLQLLLVLAGIVLFVWFAAAVLVPEYNSYVATCVTHTSNATLLSSNLYALAFNHAQGSGQGDLTNSIGQYNTRSGDLCSSGDLSSRQTYLSFLQDLLTANQSFHMTYTRWQQVAQCVDLAAMNEQITSACAGSSPSPLSGLSCPTTLKQQYADLSSALPLSNLSSLLSSVLLDFASSPASSNSSLSSSVLLLGNPDVGYSASSVYDCQQLPTFQSTCSGPSPSLVNTLTTSCSCMVEWYWNSFLAQSSMAVLVYVILNLSRALICHGMIRVLWRYLSPPIFTCTSDCTLGGKRIYWKAYGDGSRLRAKEPGGGKKGSDLQPFSGGLSAEREEEAHVQKAIASRVRMYEYMGRAMILLGCLINVVWIVLLAELDGNIAYQP